jgi:NADPH:quinone reductase-like Zn-dependent oxidoreductase
LIYMALVSSAPQHGTPNLRNPASVSTTARRSTARPRTRDGLARPKSGEVRVRVGALGMSSLGIQAAGIVSAVGPEAGGFAAGDRVSYRTSYPLPAPGPVGNADVRGTVFSIVVPERELIGFPKDVALEAAAAYLPLGLVARTIVKQLHSVGQGNRVSIAPDGSGVAAFVAAWAADLGATVGGAAGAGAAAGGGRADAASADVVVTAADYAVASQWRYANGLGQIAAADVFAEVRRGVFDDIEVTSYPIDEVDRARSDFEQRVAASPIVLLPAAA